MVRINMLVALPLLAATLFSVQSPATTWTKLGGVPGGSFGRIVVDPNNPRMVFAGSEYGGVIFRSTDGGQTYTAVQAGTTAEAFRGIAIDPKNSNILFAIGRDQLNFTQAYVYESTNAGVSWARVAHQPGNGQVLYGWAAAFDPTGGTLLTADSHYGVFRTTDLGKSWTQVLPPTVKSLVADPNDAKTFWAGGTTSANGSLALWKSSDTGKTWTSVTLPNVHAIYTLVWAIAALPNSKTVLAAWSGSDPITYANISGVLASADGGKTWKPSSSGLATDSFTPGDSIIPDPKTPGTVYMGTATLNDPAGAYRSTDSGAHWQGLGTLFGQGAFTLAVRPATQGLPAAIVAGGNDLFQSTDSGKTWDRETGGVKIASLNAVKDDLLAAKGIYGDTYDGLFHSVDGGKSWTRINTWPDQAAPVAFDVDPVSPTHNIYVATATGFWRSSNSGSSWTAIPAPGDASKITNVFADLVKAGRVYATAGNRTLYRSDNSGKTWTTLAVGGTKDSFTGVNQIALDPHTSGLLYSAVTSGFLKSSNAGATWTNTKIPNSAKAPINAFAVTGKTASTLVVAEGAQTETSTDGGKSWHAGGNAFSDGNYPYALFTQPGTGTVVAFAAGEVGKSDDGGVTWSPVDTSVVPNGFYAISVTAKTLYGFNSGNNYASPFAP